MEENEWISLYYEENEKAEKLEQENKQLKERIAVLEILAEEQLEKKFPAKDLKEKSDLLGEIAELKEKLRIATEYPEWSKTVKLAEEDCIKQLAEAKEIIKFLINPQLLDKPEYYEWRLKAEQFLNREVKE